MIEIVIEYTEKEERLKAFRIKRIIEILRPDTAKVITREVLK